MRNPFSYGCAVLRAPEGDTDTPPGGGGNAEVKDTGGFTEDQMKAIGTIVNQVVTSHKSRGPSLAEQLKDFDWNSVVAPVVKSIMPSTEPAPKGSSKPELAEYETQIKKLTDGLALAERARAEESNLRKAAESARRDDTGKSKLRTALADKVVTGAAEHVINHLTIVRNRMTVDDEGNVFLKVKRPDFPGMPPVEVDLGIEEALKHVFEEPEMKLFLPVQGGGKGGANPGPRGSVSSASFTGEAKTEAEKLQRSAIREQEMAAKYGQR